MAVLIENAYELDNIAREIGAHSLKGNLRYPSETGGWQLGELDLDEHLAKFRDRRLVLIVAPISEVELMTFVCEIHSFALNEAGECPGCELAIAEQARDLDDTGEDRNVIEQVRDWLEEEGHELPS